MVERVSSANASVPIIVLTAYTSEQEKVLCLDLGADDFISKVVFSKMSFARAFVPIFGDRCFPFNPRTGSVEELGDLSIDFERGEVRVKGEPVSLRNRGVPRFLQVLARHRGSLVTRNGVNSECMKGRHAAPTRSSMFICIISEKRSKIHSDYQLIVTEYGRVSIASYSERLREEQRGQ